MVDVITPLRFHLLQVVAKYPDIRREKLLTVRGAQEADVAYLEHLDLIREREPGAFRISHLGQMALYRGL